MTAKLGTGALSSNQMGSQPPLNLRMKDWVLTHFGLETEGRRLTATHEMDKAMSISSLEAKVEVRIQPSIRQEHGESSATRAFEDDEVVDYDPLASLPGDKELERCLLIDPSSSKVFKGFDSFSCKLGHACPDEDE